MRFEVFSRYSRVGFVAVLIAQAASAMAAHEPAATLTFRFQQAEQRQYDADEPLFGSYLGTGDGAATGALQGTVAWDLYEDQSRNDLHPALFRGFVARDSGRRHQFLILGVFTPVGKETAIAPDGLEHPRYWTLSGTIVFEDDTLLGARHAPLTGRVDLTTREGRYTVWSESRSAR